VYSARREPFNVILLVEDALRADRLGMYGHHRPTSPVRDSIADDGVLFLNPIAQATETRASVPALMTSLLPSLTGVWDFKDRLKDEYLTLAEVLRAQGFVTAAFVQNGNAGPYAGLHQGFTSSFDTELIGKKTEEILGGPLFAWLEKHRERNFFTYLHITDPHGVYDPPPPFDRWYHEAGEARRTPVERLYLDPDWEKNPTKEGRRLLYDGEIRNNDRLLEGLLDKLEELGIRENTLLVMTSDHGEYLGEGGHWMHKPPGRLQVLRVPLVMSYPARFKEPRQISSTVQSIDVMPTILELAGIDSGGLLMQGDSLVDLIEGRRPGYWENRICLSEEPIVMSRQDHQAYGSMFFRQLHVNNSPLNWPGRLPAWLKMRVFNFEKDRTQSSLFPSLLPDLWLRYQFLSVLSEVFDNNIAAHAKLTGGTDDTYKTDIEVLRQLRSLGYVQ
jgi:arylsulfatase A-like enzyme